MYVDHLFQCSVTLWAKEVSWCSEPPMFQFVPMITCSVIGHHWIPHIKKEWEKWNGRVCGRKNDKLQHKYIFKCFQYLQIKYCTEEKWNMLCQAQVLLFSTWSVRLEYPHPLPSIPHLYTRVFVAIFIDIFKYHSYCLYLVISQITLLGSSRHLFDFVVAGKKEPDQFNVSFDLI